MKQWLLFVYKYHYSTYEHGRVSQIPRMEPRECERIPDEGWPIKVMYGIADKCCSI